MVVVRTKTSALRVHELVHSAFGSDPRVKIVYVFDDGSAFNGWLTRWEIGQEVKVLTWREGCKVSHDLLITCSENVDFSKFSGHAYLFPHGVGNNKWIPARTGDRVSLSGLPPKDVLKTGRLTIVVTHVRQARQLMDATGKADLRFLVAGDVSFAILRASCQPRHVERYRRHLGTGSRKLVLVSSTWGEDAILGACPELLDCLLTQLPVDAYQVALVAHCNLWEQDGPDELHRKLQRHLRAGLVLVSPRWWHSVAASADVVVIDHGSIGLYAVAAGKPVALAASSSTEVVEGTAAAELRDVAHPLSLAEPVLPQIEAAIANHDHTAADYFINEIFEYPDDGGKIVRDHLYAHLGLTPLERNVDVLAAPLPEVQSQRVNSFDVILESYQRGELLVIRTPRAARVSGNAPPKSHLVVNEMELNDKYLANASIIVRTEPCDDEDLWLQSRDEPGCLLSGVVTADGICLVRVCLRNSPFFGSRYALSWTKGLLPLELLPSVLRKLMLSNELLGGEIERDVRDGPQVDRAIIRRS